MAGTWLLGAGARDENRRPKAVLVAVRREDETGEGAPGTTTSMAELRRLADTDGLTVVDEVVQNRGRPDAATFVGSGRADQLAAVVRDTGAPDLSAPDAMRAGSR